MYPQEPTILALECFVTVVRSAKLMIKHFCEPSCELDNGGCRDDQICELQTVQCVRVPCPPVVKCTDIISKSCDPILLQFSSHSNHMLKLHVYVHTCLYVTTTSLVTGYPLLTDSTILLIVIDIIFVCMWLCCHYNNAMQFQLPVRLCCVPTDSSVKCMNRQERLSVLLTVAWTMEVAVETKPVNYRPSSV